MTNISDSIILTYDVTPSMLYKYGPHVQSKMSTTLRPSRKRRFGTATDYSAPISNYEEKLNEVGLTTHVDRRRRGDMLQTFKILNRVDVELMWTTGRGSRKLMNSTR